MKKYFIFFGIVFILATIYFVEAKDQSVSIDYSFSTNGSYEKELDFSDVLLKINTPVDAHCRYSNLKGTSYNYMDSFDLSLGKIHQKNLIGLGDGIYKYYVKCIQDSTGFLGNETEYSIILRINSLVNAQISLAEGEPLKSGVFELNLITSKIVSQAPTLSYSFNGDVVKTSIPLVGSETHWKGYLPIEKNFGKGFVSFDFKANDLEGRQGTLITSGGVLEIDTSKPSMIGDITAVGYVDKINLEWYYDGDFEQFNIYRSLSQNPDYTDFYKTVEDKEFSDKWVEDGKTYYYRVSVLSSSGTESDLSKEVQATSLLDNSTADSGLDVSLRGKVDNLLVEIDSALVEVKVIDNSISGKTDREQNLFESLGLLGEIKKSESELNSLRQTVEKYKLQDLTEAELDNKLSSSRIRLEVLQKKIPEDLNILKESSKKEVVDDSSIRYLLLELNPSLSEKSIDKSLKKTQDIISDSDLLINSKFYVVEVLYSDGTSKKVSIVERDISDELDRNGNASFVEVIPKNLAESATEINVRNANYDVINDDPVLAFESDTKNIFYSFDKANEIDDLEEIQCGLVYLVEGEENNGLGITGYFLFNSENQSSYLVGFGILAFLIIAIYFFYRGRNKVSDEYLQLFDKTRRALDSIDKGNLNFAKDSYLSIKKDYNNLSNLEKKKLYSNLELLHERISLAEFEKGLEELKMTKNPKLVTKLDSIYKLLSVDHQKKISPIFQNLRRGILLPGGQDGQI